MKRIAACALALVMLLTLLPGMASAVSFTDVKPGEFYAEPVAWAVENGITKGTSDTTFGPKETCTRGQVVTFLWRASGEQEPTKTANPFSDVNPSAFYGKAVLWAVEQGITKGTSANAFSPNESCTRGQVVTFLHRAQGAPQASSAASFADVAQGAFYAAAVSWAVERNVTKGTSANAFSPNEFCTRGQIVTFLYRASQNQTRFVPVKAVEDGYYNRTVTWEYDEHFNNTKLIQKVSDTFVVTRDRTYNAKGEILTDVYNDGSDVVFTHTYDASGNLVKTVADYGRGDTETTVNTYVGGKLTESKITMPEQTISVTYDAHGNALHVLQDYGSRIDESRNTYQYDSHGNIVERKSEFRFTKSGGTLKLDENGEWVTIPFAKDDLSDWETMIYKYSYEYDANGNMIKSTETLPEQFGSKQTTITYEYREITGTLPVHWQQPMELFIRS